MTRRQHLIAIGAALLLGSAALAQAPARVAAKPAAADATLEAAIRERFARSKAAADGFTVRVQGGVATLEGKTSVPQRKGAATRMAKAAGAKRVVNNIQVSEAARRKAAENLATGRRRAQVKRSEPRSAAQR